MKLLRIEHIEARLELKSGLHIGAGELEMRIGGVDSPIVRDPLTRDPFIPGSSLKGKVRSLLEWRSGAVQEKPLGIGDLNAAQGSQQEEVRRILLLFGVSGGDHSGDIRDTLGPTRVGFCDAFLSEGFRSKIQGSNLSVTETKFENAINRISGTAENPRSVERVVAGASFDLVVTIRVFEGDPDLLPTLLQGFRLLELDSLGKSGSRGYGKVALTGLTCNGESLDERFRAVDPFIIAA